VLAALTPGRYPTPRRSAIPTGAVPTDLPGLPTMSSMAGTTKGEPAEDAERVLSDRTLLGQLGFSAGSDP
jgi:hypothetical protein